MTKAAARRANVRAIHEAKTPSGARAAAIGEKIRVHAPDGRLVVEYDAATGVTTIAGSELAFSADRKIALDAPEIAISASEKASVRAPSLEIEVNEASTRAKKVSLVSEELASRVGKWELRARRVVQHAVDFYRDVEELDQSRVGRVRTLVKGLFQVLSERAEIDSTDDTVIDGKRVLLG